MSTFETERLTLAGLDLGPRDETFPFMNGAGSVNGATWGELSGGFEDLIKAPGAVAMIGSFTPNHRPGNSIEHGDPVFLHISPTGLTYNSMGLPNIGMAALAGSVNYMRLFAEENNKQLAVSIAFDKGSIAEQWISMADVLLENEVKIIEFNAGCPNVFDENGNPKAVLSHDPDALGEELEKVRQKIGDDFVAGIKISPAPAETFGPDYVLDERSARLIARQAGAINRLGFSRRYVSYFNTFGGQIPVDEHGVQQPLSVPNQAGGVSGRGVAGVAEKQTDAFLWYLDKGIDVVAAGGIATGADIVKRLGLDSRIKLASAVTRLWQSESYGKGVSELALEYADALPE